MSQILSEYNKNGFDAVGEYRQDKVNGFEPYYISNFINCGEIKSSYSILDAMGGNGNLGFQINKYITDNNISNASIDLLEYSKVQCEHAKQNNQNIYSHIFWADILHLKSFDEQKEIPLGKYDVIFLKSANHEIRKENQQTLFNHLNKLLKPGGKLVIMGFSFDAQIESREFLDLTNLKDTLLNMEMAVNNRYFTTKEELNLYLNESGFSKVSNQYFFDYKIDLDDVIQEYFHDKNTNEIRTKIVNKQKELVELKKNGRITFLGNKTMMRMPGAITVAIKSDEIESSKIAFKQFSVDILSRVKTHVEMLEKVASYINKEDSVLDLGCGTGLLAGLLFNKNIHYLGVDFSEEYINSCFIRYGWQKGVDFEKADINDFTIEKDKYNTICIINTLYVPGVNPVKILTNVFNALPKKGKILLTGPIDETSLKKAEPLVFKQLEGEGYNTQNCKIFEILQAATEMLMTSKSNYYSPEGIVALLQHIGFSDFIEYNNSIYYGNAYFVSACK